MPEQDEEDITVRTQNAVVEAYEQAQDHLDEYDALLSVTALNGANPHTDETVQTQKVWLHVETMRCIRKMPRVTMREKMAPYWDDAIIYDDGQRQIVGLKALETYQGAVFKEELTESVRHHGEVDTEQWNAQLLPGPAYRRALTLIGEVLERLGYMEAPSPPKTVSVMDAHGGEGNVDEEATSDD